MSPSCGLARGWRNADRKRITAIEETASQTRAIASVSLNNTAQSQSLVNDVSQRLNLTDCTFSTIKVRIWGGRPYQPVEDNDISAKEHWRESCFVSNKEGCKNLIETVETMNAGRGPGLPDHYPTCFDQFTNVQIQKIACAKSTVYFLSKEGNVYSLGVCKHASLGHGPRIGLIRDPLKIRFPTSNLRRDRDSDQFGVINMTMSQLSSAPLENEMAFGDDASHPIKIRDIVCGDYHVLALSESGMVYAWGKRNACGFGSLSDVSEPALLEFFSSEPDSKEDLARVSAIGAGKELSLAILSDGQLYVWGQIPMYGLSFTPLLVGKFDLPDEDFDQFQICVGEMFGLIISGHGKLYQFGCGVRGEVIVASEFDSDETKTFIQSCPSQLTHMCPQSLRSYLERIDPRLREIRQCAAGSRHVLLLNEEGNVFAWGDNQWGQCGLGPSYHSIEKPTMLTSNGLPATSIIAGGCQSGFIDWRGQVYVWGCTGDHRLINTTVKHLVNAKSEDLSNKLRKKGASTSSMRLGESSECSVIDSFFTPRLVPLLVPFISFKLGMGHNYTVVATGTRIVQQPNPRDSTMNAVP